MRLTLSVVAALLSLTITATAQVSSASAVDSGRIAGRVVTTYAELVGGAIVTLSRVNDQGMRFQLRTTRTDDSGGFSFTNLPGGRYGILASKDGYTSRQLPSASERGPGFTVGPEVDLDEHDVVPDLQVIVQRMASIAGRIIRPDGSAAPDVQVQLAVPSPSGKGRRILFDARTTSGSDGRYEITGLPPGDYLLGAMNVSMPARQSLDAAKTTQEELHWSWYPGVRDAEPGSAITVLEGVKAEGIDVWLTPSQRFSVSGRVFWPVGVSVENITVDYGDPDGALSGMWSVSDPGGLFTLTGIAPGALTMLVRADSDQGPLIGVASTEVAVDSVEAVRIVLDRPGLVAGRIVYEGAVPSASRATSVVAVQKLLKVSALYPVPESAIDSSGRFELTGAVGEYEFALDGLAPGLAIKRVMRGDKALPMNRIGVAAGEAIRDIEIVVGR